MVFNLLNLLKKNEIMRRSFTYPPSKNTTLKSIFSSIFTFILVLFSASAFAQLCPENPFQIEVDPTNSSKCRVIFTFPTGQLPEIGCDLITTPAPGSDATFNGEITYFSTTDLFGTTVSYDNSIASGCTGPVAKLQYHPTIPNAIMTVYAPQFCNYSVFETIEVEIGNTNSGSTETCTISNPSFPVEWVSFDGFMNSDRTIDLEWVVATQLNNSHFEVQYSRDGEDYRVIDIVKGSGTTSDMEVFVYTHNTPSYGKNYYRLKQIDFDGVYEYSEIVTVNFESERVANVFPNVLFGDQIMLELNSEVDGTEIDISIVSMNGFVHQTERVIVDQGLFLHQINLPRLSRGMYIVYVHTADKPLEHYKIIKMLD